MPKYTKNYGLIAFELGDVYSAQMDSQRIHTLDNLMSYMSDIIGDGVIDGWGLSDFGSNPSSTEVDCVFDDSASYQIKITPGNGLIDRFYTRTFGDLYYELKESESLYLYMQRKRNYLASFSNFSDIEYIDHTDSIAPDTPINAMITSSAFNEIVLSWDSNIEPDFSHYIIQRSNDGISFENIASNIQVNTYSDDTVVEGETFYYRVIAVDYSENQSLPTANIIVNVPDDLRKPLPPANILTITGNGNFQSVWVEPEFRNIHSYNIIVNLLNDQNEIENTVFDITTTNNYIEVDGLTNGRKYKIDITSISTNGISSSSESRIIKPKTVVGPPEVENVSIAQYQSSINDTGIRIEVQWEDGIDPYRDFATRFSITLIENGSIQSDPIYINDFGLMDYTIDLETYKINGVLRPILPRTNYYIKIQAINDDGISRGRIGHVKTDNYIAPGSPYNLNSILTDNGDLLFTWKNSKDIFSYNIINVIKKNLVTNSENTIENNLNIGKNKSYLIEGHLDFNTQYTIYIKAIDEFGLVSEEVSLSYTTNEQSSIPVDIPLKQFAMSGNKEVFLGWQDPDFKTTQNYKIWRADYAFTGLQASDFSLIANIDAKPDMNFIDYSVENDKHYLYFVTKVNVYGEESENPTDDGVFSYPLVKAYPNNSHEDSINMGDISVIGSGLYDTIITWDADINGAFDGYEIYRSNNTLTDWEKIGYVCRQTNKFIDNNSRLINGYRYYYMVRKYRDEARLVAQSSMINPPVDSVLLAKISAKNGNLTVTDMRINLYDLTEMVDKYTGDLVDEHRHFNDLYLDRRIDLSKNITINSWQTVDGQIFTTTESFAGASNYRVFINGSETELLFDINPTTKKLIFEENVGIDSTISVECIDLSEFQNVLPKHKLREIFTTIFQNGEFDSCRIPVIDHYGSYNNSLIPLQIPMNTDDGYNFDIYANKYSDFKEIIGNTNTFFDVIDIQGSLTDLIAIGSYGILYSEDLGATWDQVFEPGSVLTRLFYLSGNGYYVAVGAGEAYISKNGYTWVAVAGLRGASSIRFASEKSNIIYLTSDIGVYEIDLNSSFGSIINASPLSAISHKTSNCFAMWVISNILYVSTDIGVFYSDDNGITWNYSDIYPEFNPIFDITTESNNIFAISNYAVWRFDIANDTIFQDIADFEGDIARRITVANGRLIISSSDGIKISESSYDIFNSISLKFNNDGIASINDEYNKFYAYCIKQLDSKIVASTDGKFYVGDNIESMELAYNDISSIAPKIYVNNKNYKIGSYYYIGNDSIYFEDKISTDSIVSVANQYIVFRSKNKGWLEGNYAANVDFVINSDNLYTLAGSSVSSVLSSFEEATFISRTSTPRSLTEQGRIARSAFEGIFNNGNSNLTRVNEYIDKYNNALSFVQDAIDDTSILNNGKTLASIVGDLTRAFYDVYSQLHDQIKFYDEITINDESFYVIDNLRLPSSIAQDYFKDHTLVKDVSDVTTTIIYIDDFDNEVTFMDVATGIIAFDNSFTKYDDLKINIGGSSLIDGGILSHEDLEDKAFGLNNSGLPLKLTNTAHANLIGMGLFLDDLHPDQQEQKTQCGYDKLKPINYNYISVLDNKWYDELNSTIDYKIESDITGNTIGLDYIFAAIYFQNVNKVLAASDDGLICIDDSSYEIEEIIFDENNKSIFDLNIHDDILYIVSNKNIYYSNNLLSWNVLDTSGVSGNFYKIYINDRYSLLMTDSGIFYKTSAYSSWDNVYEFDTKPISVINDGNYSYIIGNNKIYYSPDGRNWTASPAFDDVILSSMVKYYANIAIATNSGLRYDMSTFSTTNPQLSLVDILDNVNSSKLLGINDVSVNNSELVAFSDNGTYYKTSDGSSFTSFNSDLPTIQVGIHVGSDIWMFGFDLLRVEGQAGPILLSSGNPM